MSNFLPHDKRLRVAEMLLAGATVREVQAETGVARQTIVSLTLGGYRREVLHRFREMESELEQSMGEEIYDITSKFSGWLGWVCPLHPDAGPEVMGDDGMVCGWCVRDGLRRHHARRKAQGRPVLPPRVRRTPTSLQKAVAQPRPPPRVPRPETLGAEPVPAKKSVVFERLGTAIFPTTRPPSLDDVPTGLPKVEPGSAAVHTSRGKPRVPPLLAQDEINDHAARERVCGPCVRPGEQVFGKSLRASSDACPRCKRPCAQGFVVRGEVRHVAPDPRTQRRAFVCPCGLNAKQRRVQKHVCPAVRTKGAA